MARIAAEIRDLEQQMARAQDAERVAALAASNAAAVAGYTRRQVGPVRDAALLGWARFMAPLAGLMGAFPGQAAGAPMIASADFAAYYGQPTSWVTGQWAAGTTAASGAGLAAALLGDRLIKNMVAVVVMGAAGSAALLVLGMVPAAMLFFPSVFVVGSMGVAGGLVRGRMDRYHPVARELKDAREARYETAFKAAQFVLPVAIGQGMAVVGFQVTMLGLAVLAAALTAGVWLVLRGEGRGAQPRAPPAVWSSVVGSLRQMIGTPHGLLRAALSIPLLTALTGLYATALGGAMVDQLVLLNDPTQAMFATTAVGVSVLVTVRGLATMFTGSSWPKLKALLGSPGAVAKALGRDVQVGPVSEARVLRGVTLLPVVLALPAVWLVLTPGLWPFGALLTTGAVLAAWARMPLNRWIEGATGASLNNTAKAGTIALGGAVSAALLGQFSTQVSERVAAGQPYADVVAAGNLRLALLVIPVVVLPALVAHLIGKLRVGTLDELRTALENAGASEAVAAGIGAKLAARGLNDVGSARALFLASGWAPRLVPAWRLAQNEARRKSVELTPDELAWLETALATFGPTPVPGGPGRGHRRARGQGRGRGGGARPHLGPVDRDGAGSRGRMDGPPVAAGRRADRERGHRGRHGPRGCRVRRGHRAPRRDGRRDWDVRAGPGPEVPRAAAGPAARAVRPGCAGGRGDRGRRADRVRARRSGRAAGGHHGDRRDARRLALEAGRQRRGRRGDRRAEPGPVPDARQPGPDPPR